jgi:hypothetical protein
MSSLHHAVFWRVVVCEVQNNNAEPDVGYSTMHMYEQHISIAITRENDHKTTVKLQQSRALSVANSSLLTAPHLASDS